MSGKIPHGLGDVLSGALILAFGAWSLLWLINAQVSIVPGIGEDAQLYPRVLATILVILGAGIVLATLITRAEPRTENAFSKSGFARVLCTAFCIAGFVLVSRYSGFVLASFLALAGFSLVAGVRHPIAIGVLSGGTTAVLFLFVADILGLPLPG